MTRPRPTLTSRVLTHLTKVNKNFPFGKYAEGEVFSALDLYLVLLGNS